MNLFDQPPTPEQRAVLLARGWRAEPDHPDGPWLGPDGKRYTDAGAVQWAISYAQGREPGR